MDQAVFSGARLDLQRKMLRYTTVQYTALCYDTAAVDGILATEKRTSWDFRGFEELVFTHSCSYKQVAIK